MSQQRLPPPEPEPCLVRRYASSQKGGTLIAEGVVDQEAHRRRLCDPDGYRPKSCPTCLGTVLHVHDYRERQLRADPGSPVATVVRHACMGCQARWQILPEFVARHLWRSWRVVEHATMPSPEQVRMPPIPDRTVRRWSARLASAARLLVQVLAISGNAFFTLLLRALPEDPTRCELVSGFASLRQIPAGRRLSVPASLLHRLTPGVRLM